MTRKRTTEIEHAYTGTKLQVELDDLEAVRELTALGEHVLIEREIYVIEVPASAEMIDGEPEYSGALDSIIDGIEFICLVQ